MEKAEYEHWQAVTESSIHQWVEDTTVRLNGRGARYYTGGENGTYMEIKKDGTLTVGCYEGAVPHIGEAYFTPHTAWKKDTFDEAFQLALQVGGKKFLADLFSSGQLPPDASWVTQGLSGESAPNQGPVISM